VGQDPEGDSNIEKFSDRFKACSQKEWAFLFFNDLRTRNTVTVVSTFFALRLMIKIFYAMPYAPCAMRDVGGWLQKN
jgi:hypothetical protein